MKSDNSEFDPINVNSVARARGLLFVSVVYLGFRSLCSLHPGLHSAASFAGYFVIPPFSSAV